MKRILLIVAIVLEVIVLSLAFNIDKKLFGGGDKADPSGRVAVRAGTYVVTEDGFVPQWEYNLRKLMLPLALALPILILVIYRASHRKESRATDLRDLETTKSRLPDEELLRILKTGSAKYDKEVIEVVRAEAEGRGLPIDDEIEPVKPEKIRPQWNCPNCGSEVEGDFDICWNCEFNRDDSQSKDTRP